MKAQKLNLIAQSVEFDVLKEAEILHEQLALKRLRPWRWLRRALALAWRLFEPVELVMLVGPNHRPLQRHEWERSDQRFML
jgi:hypothetical protein